MRKPRLTKNVAAALKNAAVVLNGEAEALDFDAGEKLADYNDKEYASEYAKRAADLYLVKDYISNLARWYEYQHEVKFDL